VETDIMISLELTWTRPRPL